MMRTAIVTGAARGIGAAISDELVSEGYFVWCLDVDPDRLAARVDELNSGRADCVAGLVCDIRSLESVLHAIAVIERRTPVIDLLVNNAFSWTPSGMLADVPDATFTRDIDLLLLGPQRVTAAARGLLASGSAIVTIASVHGMTASPHWGTYDIAKAALIQWARVTAAEVGPEGITSNVIAPGIIATTPYNNTDLRRTHVSAGLVNRIGEPEDVARLVGFLGDPRNSFITGTVIPVDGGMTTRLSLTVIEGVSDAPSISKGDY